MKKIQKSQEDWKKKLTPEQFFVTRQKGTEPPFSGKYYAYKKEGMYHCSNCGAVLFSSDTKYDSGTGWPSFYKPEEDNAVEEKEDHDLGLKRTEVICKKCGAHLGHVFNDGPKPTGQRYCINSAALNFMKKQDME